MRFVSAQASACCNAATRGANRACGQRKRLNAPCKIFYTIVTRRGIVGALLAGMIAARGSTGFHRAGFIASIVGAMVLIFLGRMLNLG